jgi:hypothetical protein
MIGFLYCLCVVSVCVYVLRSIFIYYIYILYLYTIYIPALACTPPQYVLRLPVLPQTRGRARAGRGV